MKKVTVVGAGPGNPELLTIQAKLHIKRSDIVFATGRLFEKLGSLNQNTVRMTLSGLAHAVQAQPENVDITILASGDVGFYSISSLLTEQRGCVLSFQNGLSSLQYFCARLRVPYDDIKTVSVHGRDVSALPAVCYHPRVFVLTGGHQKAHDVICELISCGLGYVSVCVGENLSDETERIVRGTAQELSNEHFTDLAVMLVENPASVRACSFLRDADFVRGKVPMTKEAVRSLCVARLGITPTDVVYDIGAGTGSVACAMARFACESFVYAVEQNEDGISLIHENRQKLGAYNVKAIHGAAPECLKGLPAPDKVFIGGSSGNLGSIIDAALEKNPDAKILATAVTLETQAEALRCFSERGIAADAMCVNVSQAEPLGSYRLMKAQNPVWLIGGARNG